ncbi:hypothetical protein M9H77_13417 [Catharanthus roseus]|uniref:Uncharacterized protein n=1 Tax=Catharanthus roseus TaxID=4058 RepID=A0ACC0BKA2_CATRO|nr:hypothetical protein M9H77_13417 [Catharanthus roseus]
MNAKTYLIITRYQRSRTADRRLYVTLACERGGSIIKYKKVIVDDEEEEVPKKKVGTLVTKKCGCPFKLKGEQRTTNESLQLFVHNRRHNHKAAVYNHDHAPTTRLMKEQLHQTEQFRKKIYDVYSAQNIYNVVAKIKRNRMHGRNTVEEVLCLNAQRGYTVFHRNRKEINVLSDIVVAHPTSIAMIKIRRIDQNVLAKLLEMVKDEEVAQRFVNGSWKKLINEIDDVEYQRKLEVLKTRWKSSDLDTVFLNINSLIQGQIAEIKYTLEISKLKEKYGAKSNAILKNLSNNISHLALKKIIDELKKAREMVEKPGSNCLHYLRKLHGLPCACKLVHRCQYLIPIREEDVDIFGRKLEIGSDIPEEHDRDMDSEMRELKSLIHEVSMGPISKVREVRHLIKDVISPVLPEDPCQPLTIPPETAITKGRWKTNSTKRDKSHWEYVSVVHRKIGKSSGSGSNREAVQVQVLVLVHVEEVGRPVAIRVGVVSNFLFGDENHWVEIHRRMCFDLHHRMNVYVQLFGLVEHVTELIRQTNWEEDLAPADYWMDTPDHFYVVTNTLNLCVIFLARLGSTTVLPLVSNMDGNAETIFIGFIEEQQHFIQLHLRDGCSLPLL